MSDLTPAFDELLKGRGAPSTKRSFSVEEVEEFLKKAYSIVRIHCPGYGNFVL